ncbi:MAG: GNAT family N-acetyltransferase, partial [Candidatus Cloacimonetes bacterium]|nr:GNAT family N-acetyltransferase [Candidatus Cloacimonadota bacterium]
SLPYWKTISYQIPNYIKVELEEYNKESNEECEKYFKVIHYLDSIENPWLPEDFTLTNISIEEYVNHINSCYDDIRLSIKELKEYQNHRVYDENLWIAIKDIRNNKIVATGIGEMDNIVREGILEWVQVSKEYRRKGLGKYIVNELLFITKDKAKFVTVSSKLSNKLNPLSLYKNYGFINKQIWNIYQSNR